MEISIVVPVYKVKDYLRDCANSIINQSYNEFELILIDDGTPDECSILCESYSLLDNRIKVVHKRNGGLSSARNVGISLATGKYIAFVDSDDYIDNDFLKEMHNAFVMYDTDIVCCGIKRTGSLRILVDVGLDIVIYERPDCMKLLVENNSIGDYYMNKVFKAGIFNNFSLPEGKIYEDIFTMHILFSKANRIATLDKYLYYYRTNPTGISHSKKLNARYMDFVYACKEKYEYYKEHYPIFANMAITKYCKGIIHLADVLLEKGSTEEQNVGYKELLFFAKECLSEFKYIGKESANNQVYYEIQQLSKGKVFWKLYYFKKQFVVSLHNHPKIQKFVVRALQWNFIPSEC